MPNTAFRNGDQYRQRTELRGKFAGRAERRSSIIKFSKEKVSYTIRSRWLRLRLTRCARISKERYLLPGSLYPDGRVYLKNCALAIYPCYNLRSTRQELKEPLQARYTPTSLGKLLHPIFTDLPVPNWGIVGTSMRVPFEYFTG